MNHSHSNNFIRESAKGYQALNTEDILLTARKVFLTSEVDAESMDILLKNLMALNEQDPESEITLYINSPGGNVMDGLGVFDYLKDMEAPLRTVCCGTCASMGAILFLAGKRREIYPHGRIMIHDPSYGTADIGGKKPHEIQKQVDSLMETREMLATIIADVTGKTLEEIYEVTKEDTFYNASKAVEFGLATGIIGSKADSAGKNERSN